MTVINTNVKALYTQSALKQAERASQTAMQQLSTGKRINSSKDDAAGLAIAARMTQNIKGMNQSIRNAGDAISLIQVAEGATNEITAMLQRMSELAVQSSNSTYSTEQRGYLDQEFQQLKQEIVRISETHEWNGFPILNGKAGTPVGYPTVTTDKRPGVSANQMGLALKEGDLVIEVTNPDGSKRAVPIGPSLSSYDRVSNEIGTSSSKAASAIAIAAAINAKVGQTGVRATALGAEINATRTVVGTKSIQTDIYINGTKINLSLTAGQTTGERRQYVIDSINAKTAIHGVSAGDGGNGGLSLKTIDGRNLSVWYDKTAGGGTGISGQDFGLGGEGDLASDPEGVSGLQGPAACAVNTLPTIETVQVRFKPLFPGESITVSGLTFTADADLDQPLNATQVATLFTNLNSGTSSDLLNEKNISESKGTFYGALNGFSTGVLNDSDNSISFTSSEKGDIANISASIDNTLSKTIVRATNEITLGLDTLDEDHPATPEINTIQFKLMRAGEKQTIGGVTFTAERDLSASSVRLAFESYIGGTVDSRFEGDLDSSKWELETDRTGLADDTMVINASEPGKISSEDKLSLATELPSDSIELEASITNSGTGGVKASTVYGSVTLNSNSAFTVRPGARAYPSTGSTTSPASDPTFTNFSSLGFNADTFSSKNIGRLSFQVGPSPDQLISIDLADFGQNGEITGAITSDKAPTNILTVQAANDVTQSVNKSLDMIAQTRASMGAVMNRLEHVIDNLTNVVMNSEASRSQIEDADYAKASTELARTQIMQQAATAVLAQANTSQQSVLKLLQA